MLICFFFRMLTASFSYTTPQTGLGCRSLTILVYFLSQVVMILLYIMTLADLRSNGTHAVSPGSKLRSVVSSFIWYTCTSVCICASLFTSMAGTGKSNVCETRTHPYLHVLTLGCIALVHLGLYSNCLCAIPVCI